MTTITNKDEMTTVIDNTIKINIIDDKYKHGSTHGNGWMEDQAGASCSAEELNQVRAENAKLKEKVEYLESDAPRWKTHSDQTFISIDDFFNLRRAMKNKIDHLEKMLNGK